jgi:hypothetical protein
VPFTTENVILAHTFKPMIKEIKRMVKTYLFMFLWKTMDLNIKLTETILGYHSINWNRDGETTH